MNQLIIGNIVTMSSQEIADLVGSRHDNVKIAIDRLVSRGVISQPAMQDGQKSGNGVIVQEYRVCKRDSFIVVAQLSPEFTAALVDRWQELEQSTTPKTFADALRLAADQQEQIEHQQAQLAIAAPKAEFVDRYVEGTGLKGFRQVAKLIKAKENLFREFLVDQKIQYRLGGEWCAYQNHIDAGRFEVRTGSSQHSDHVFTEPKFTPKGVNWIAGLWAKNLLEIQK